MKLRDSEIEKLSRMIFSRLAQNNNIEMNEKEGIIVEQIQKVFKDNLKAEHLINLEVKRVMEQYSGQMKKGAIDSGKMFSMIKKKLAAEKKFIL